MLRHVQAIDAGLVGGLGEGETFVEADAKRLIPVIRKIGRLDEK